MEQRLQKLLAAAGVASRRKAEELIREGRVSVDGVVASIGDMADLDRQRIEVDGHVVDLESLEYWLVHKPRGVISTCDDPEGRRTVVELLPPGRPRLFPVGRLDLESEGLMLLTNDGAVMQTLLHPSFQSPREYRVVIKGKCTRQALEPLTRGVRIEDAQFAPMELLDLQPGSGQSVLYLRLREGKKREIRRVLASLGFPVLELLRLSMGPLQLGSLVAGSARPLDKRETRALLDFVVQLRTSASTE